MKPPAIVYVHNRPVPANEANIVAVMQMCAGLAGHGAWVRLATFGRDRKIDPFAAYSVAPSFSLRCVPKISGPAAYPTLLITALFGAPAGAIVYTRIPQVAVLALMARRKVVLEMHYPIGELRRGAWALKRLNRPDPNLLAVIAISPALQSRLGEELDLATAPIVLASTGALDFRGDLGADTPFDVGFVGSFLGGRGLDLIFELAARRPSKRFLMVGGPITPEIAARAAGLPNLTLRPPIDHREIASVLSSFSIALAPYAPTIEIANSKINTAPWMSPMKLIEYMSAQKAIIASRLPAIEFLVRDGEDALLAEPGDAESWLGALDRLDDTSLRKSVALGARRRFEMGLSWDARAANVLAAIEASTFRRC